MARPTDYTPELAEDICKWIAGGKSLRSFCRKPKTPHFSTVCRWIVQNDVFRDQYLRAREAAGFAHADNIVDMVDMIQAKKLEPNAAKVMMDGLKWAAERMAPKHHSPKHNIAHTSQTAACRRRPGS